MITFNDKGELVITDEDWEAINRLRLEFYSNHKIVPLHKRLDLPREGGRLTKMQKDQIIERWKKERKESLPNSQK